MHHPLVPCPSCARHVRATEKRCPFCAVTLGRDLANGVLPGAAQRLSRSASFVFSATVAIAGCAAAVGPTGDRQPDVAVDTASADRAVIRVGPDAIDTGPTDEGSVFPSYGQSGWDSGVRGDSGAVGDDVPADEGNVFPPYGHPAWDSGVVEDEGGPQAGYGSPPPPDAGPGADV